MLRIRYLLSVVALVASASALAQLHDANAIVVAQATPQSATMAAGEVRKIDKDAGKITLKHGPIANLDMPGMTMVFQVKDRTMLDAVKTGDRVRFSAEKAGGALTVTQIEPAK
jgi:Cu(I)/Ag(I) efflux system periplasmic protein CusF